MYIYMYMYICMHICTCMYACVYIYGPCSKACRHVLMSLGRYSAVFGTPEPLGKVQ